MAPGPTLDGTLLRVGSVRRTACGGLLAGALVLVAADRGRAPAAPPARGMPALARLPTAFVPNLGQWDGPARFVGRIGGGDVFFEDRGFTLCMGQESVRLEFANAQPPELAGEARLPGVHNYFLGSDPRRWRTNVPLHGAVRWREPWPGVEVRCYEKDGQLEYDVELAAGADLAAVEFTVEGARRLSIDGDGALVVETAGARLRQAPPVTHAADRDGARHALVAQYELRGADRFGFAVPQWRGEQALLIDPGLSWSTFVGGTSSDRAWAVAIDGNGIVTIAGDTDALNFPVTAGALRTAHNGPTDAFVTRLDPARTGAQQLVFSTFVGGSSFDEAHALAVDAAGIVTIAGSTYSTDWPTTAGAWDGSHNGGFDSFVTRLDPARSGAQQLVWSTFLGGAATDFAYAVAVDGSGIATVAGYTASADHPATAGAFGPQYRGGGSDSFVARLDPARQGAQQLVWSTYVGGSGAETARAVSVDAAGVVTIAGHTGSPDFPATPRAWSTALQGVTDAFVMRLDPSRSGTQQLLWSTLVGGSAGDAAFALSVDGSGVAMIAGNTESWDWPATAGAWDTSYNGGSDAFVARLDPSAPAALQLVWSTFVGGAAADSAHALAVDEAGCVTIAGMTASAAWPATAGAFDVSYNGGMDAFVSRLDPALAATQQLLYSSYAGGSRHDVAWAVAVDASGSATFAGESGSYDYPTTAGAWAPTYNGAGIRDRDAVVTRFDLLPVGASAYGVPTPGCAGPPRLGVGSWPQVGNASFLFLASGAAANTWGLLAVGAAGVATPAVVAGASVWIDLRSPVVTILLPSNGAGAARAPVAIPPNPLLAGLRAFAQCFWLDPCAPGGVSASNALAITVQP